MSEPQKVEARIRHEIEDLLVAADIESLTSGQFMLLPSVKRLCERVNEFNQDIWKAKQRLLCNDLERMFLQRVAAYWRKEAGHKDTMLKHRSEILQAVVNRDLVTAERLFYQGPKGRSTTKLGRIRDAIFGRRTS